MAGSQGAAGIFRQLTERHPCSRSFLGAGFFDTRRPNFFGVIPHTLELAKLELLTRPETTIHVTYGDADHF